MSDWAEYKSAEDFLITVPIPDGYQQAIKSYHENPFVAEAVRLYADMNDMTVDEVLKGRNGGAVSVKAPYMGASVIGEAVRMQDMIDKSQKKNELEEMIGSEMG